MSFEGTGLDRNGGSGDRGNTLTPLTPSQAEGGDIDAADTSDGLRMEDLQRSERALFGGGGNDSDLDGSQEQASSYWHQ